MKKTTVFQPFEDENKDCGLACLAMITHKPANYFRDRLRIRTTRATRKKELVTELQKCGYGIVQRGRISGRTRLIDLEHNALLLGKLRDDDEEFGHWAVRDASAKVLRDPNGYRTPYRITWYATLRKR